MDRKISRILRSTMLATLVFSGIGVVLPALSADGIIVITRDVQPRVATRPSLIPDPNPQTVNANVSPTVNRAVKSYELSDGDFASITSGSSLQGNILPGGQLPGLGAPNSGQNMPGMSAGRTGGGNIISNPLNRSLQQGLAPLKALTGDR